MWMMVGPGIEATSHQYASINKGHFLLVLFAQVRQNYLETIDNLMQADGDSLVDSQADNQSSTRY